jgi:MFS family permease
MVNRTGGANSDPEAFSEETPPFHPASPEEQYLRNRSSYMAPGALDKGRLLSRVILGALANVIFFGLCIFLLASLTGFIYVKLFSGIDEAAATANTSATLSFTLGLGAAWVLLGFVGALTTGSTSRTFHVYGERVFPLFAGSLLLLVALPELLAWLRAGDDTQPLLRKIVEATPAIGGAALSAGVAYGLFRLASPFAGARTVPEAAQISSVTRRLPPKVTAKIKRALVLALAGAAGPLLFSAAFAYLVVVAVDNHSDWRWVLAVGLALLALALAVLRANITSWSLHPFYRRRLSSAFALRRVCFPPVDGQSASPCESVAEERPYLSLVPLIGGKTTAVRQPVLLVCAAVNVSDPGATPPGRSVTSFVFSPNAIGGPLVGWTPTLEYCGEIPDERIVTLPGAVAASGAALSPSMGKMTRAPIRFLMVLANIRLGVWVPNPMRQDEFYRRPGRFNRPGPLLLFRELTGTNKIDARYLYVTDGGHYENLGLVELLRRGCTDVYCFDASGGRDTKEFGDAMAIARSELDVRIDIDTSALIPGKHSGFAGTHYVVGEIRYPDGTSGRLIYVRSVLTRDAPQDVRSHHENDPEFPHNSTGDQLYTDQKFEAYRALGAHAAAEVLEDLREFAPGAA